MKSFPQFDKMLKLEMACWIALYGSQFFLSFFKKNTQMTMFYMFRCCCWCIWFGFIIKRFCLCAGLPAMMLVLLLFLWPIPHKLCDCMLHAIIFDIFFLLYLNYAHSVLSLPAFFSFMLAISGAILCKCAYCMHQNGKWKHFFPPCNGMDALSG